MQFTSPQPLEQTVERVGRADARSYKTRTLSDTRVEIVGDAEAASSVEVRIERRWRGLSSYDRLPSIGLSGTLDRTTHDQTLVTLQYQLYGAAYAGLGAMMLFLLLTRLTLLAWLPVIVLLLMMANDVRKLRKIVQTLRTPAAPAP